MKKLNFGALGVSGGPLGLQGRKWSQKRHESITFLGVKMDKKSMQEGAKIRPIFEANFKRLPGAILTENDLQIGAKIPKMIPKTR